MKLIYSFVCLLFFFSQVQAQSYYQESEKGNVNRFTYVKPPSTFLNRDALSKIQTSTITFTYIGNWDPQAKIAADYAAYIWSYLINSNKPIKIEAELKSLSSGALASTTIVKWVENFPNAPLPNVKYPITLAEAISDQELNLSNEYEIHIDVNSNETDWYYGLDGNTPAEKVDFLTVILHEITHGLGFAGSFQNSGGVGSWGNEGKPDIYDLFPVFGSISSTTYKLTNTQTYPNPSNSLGDALTSNNIYFDGWKTKLMNNDQLPKLYAPNVWAGGSSISHFDEDYYPAGNSNSLMSFRIDLAEAIHSPGEVGLAVLEDLGWDINRLITVLEPNGGLVYQPGNSPIIRWTDNQNGAISIDLYKYINGEYFYHSTITSYISQQGTMNEYDNWVVPNDNGTFKIRMLNPSTGEGYGDSDPFIISNLPTVAAPVITPAGNVYPPPPPELEITISCATTGANIYYTEDGSVPSGPPQINGTLYQNPFTIDSDRTIKAKAFKTGLNESGLATEVYIFSTIQEVATVTPTSGEYPNGTKYTVSWPIGYQCFQTETTSEITLPPDPPDPQSVGGGYEFTTNPATRTLSFFNYKMKFQLYKNGQWGPVVFRQYEMKPETRIAQIDDEITGGENSFGIWHRWENNNWQSYPDHLFIRPTTTENWFLKAKQDFKEPTVSRKYQVWKTNSGINYFVNHAQVTISTNTSSVLAHFKQAYDATVKNNLEGCYPVNLNSFYFLDPWFIDDNSDSKGMRNRGTGTLTEVPIGFKTTPNITTDSDHMGVFLNQGLPNWNPPYYSVKTNLTQNLTLYNTGNPAGRNHYFIFQNWGGTNVAFEDANARGTGVVFTDINPVVNANYKGTQLSNNQNAFSNQRKFIRTYDQQYNTTRFHLVYESMNKVWYERSTDGINWEIMNNGQPIYEGIGKHPSLDALPGSHSVIIVYNKDEWVIAAQYYQDGIFKFESIVCDNGWVMGNAKPVIACAPARFMIAWNDYSGYINYRFGQLCTMSIPPYYYFCWYFEPRTVVYSEGTVKNNVTIAAAIRTSDYKSYWLCWDSNQSAIQVVNLKTTDDVNFQESQAFTFDQTGFSKNYKPSVIVWKNGTETYDRVRVSWIAFRKTYPADNPQGGGEQPLGETKVFFRSYDNGVWSAYNSYGVNVTSVSINKNSDNSYAFAWSEGDGIANKFIRGDNPTSIRVQNTSGKYLQVGNYANLNSMRLMSFKTSAPPYYFLLSNAFNWIPPQQTEPPITDREGVITKDTTSLYFSVGEITVDGEKVNFVELSDTLVINGSETLNTYLISEPFNLTENTFFTYGVQYGVTDSLSAALSLTEGKTVNFKVELIDEQTNEVLGTFDDVTFSEGSIIPYESIAYQVNTEGIGNRNCRLRLVIDDNLNPDYSLTNDYNGEAVLSKQGFVERTLNVNEIVKTYELEQNYPNPFNPATTIKYQIPKDGIVTLKIYDILGSEVATLVNEEKPAGRYEINFNASSLASGVYLYKLQVNDFINVKKMILLK
ncbi:MAG: chitobiase/beta-hexosaminidase C-terminal domain-containing protein [Ignavibacteriaceae bacterium]|nr:chitobiase/beta-hexosaminidase C-terminal domain-containing protein [Ignavibacteriaceae bacterium]